MIENIYNPNKWLIVQVNSSPIHYRVFGTWSGGYLDGDAWRLNSGITKIEEDGDYYLIHGYSGSIYKVHKEMYGIAGGYNYGILTPKIESGKYEIMPEETNWLEFDFNNEVENE